jgi:hypothetical protein
MGNIILPPAKYHFMKPEARSLDLDVDALTRAFDTDANVRQVFAEQYFWNTPPASWRETSIASIPGRIARAMLNYFTLAKKEITQYTLPTIVVPGDTAEYEKRLAMRDAWEDDFALQREVDDFEKAVEESFFEFCKQSMSHLLANVAGAPFVGDHSKRYQELHKSMQRFKPEVFSACDTIYYNYARARFNDAAPKAEVLQKHELGKLFVILPADLQEMIKRGI